MLRKLFLILSLLVTGSSAKADMGDRRMVIDTVITGGTLAPLNEYMTGILSKNVKLAEGGNTIDLVINSPGGSVVAGFEFVSLMNALQDKGYKFNCYVYHVAASMAFQILLQCDERHTLNGAFLLWHRARVFIGGFEPAIFTAPVANTLSRQLQLVDDQIYADLRKKLTGADDAYTRWHFENETLHIGRALGDKLPGFIQSHAAIPQLIETLTDKKVIRTSKGGFFDVMKPDEIIYQTTKVSVE